MGVLAESFMEISFALVGNGTNSVIHTKRTSNFYHRGTESTEQERINLRELRVSVVNMKNSACG